MSNDEIDNADKLLAAAEERSLLWAEDVFSWILRQSTDCWRTTEQIHAGVSELHPQELSVQDVQHILNHLHRAGGLDLNRGSDQVWRLTMVGDASQVMLLHLCRQLPASDAYVSPLDGDMVVRRVGGQDMLYIRSGDPDKFELQHDGGGAEDRSGLVFTFSDLADELREITSQWE